MAPRMEVRSWTSLSNVLLFTSALSKVFYQDRVYCCSCRASEIGRHGSERFSRRLRVLADRDLPALHPGHRSLRARAAALRGTVLFVGIRGGDDGVARVQYAVPAHAELRD